MAGIKNLETYKVQALKTKCKVIEATIKKTYITYPHEPMTEEMIKEEWFGRYMNQSHAYKDGSHIGNADELVDLKFLKEGEEVIDEKTELLDCIQNFLGFFDTPIAKMKMESKDCELVRQIGRDLMTKYGRNYRGV